MYQKRNLKFPSDMFDYYKKRIKKENVPRIYTERYNIFYIVEKKTVHIQ